MNKLLEEARELLDEVEYPQEYSREEWGIALEETNCYPYAIGLKMNRSLLIGDLIGKRVTDKNTIADQLTVFYEEMDALGFEVLECDTEDLIDEDQFKIYIEWNAKREYHFLREDADGIWSHKASGFAPMRTDQTGYQIVNPDSMLDAMGNYGQCFVVSRI